MALWGREGTGEPPVFAVLILSGVPGSVKRYFRSNRLGRLEIPGSSLSTGVTRVSHASFRKRAEDRTYNN
jgi:hypothetical protein